MSLAEFLLARYGEEESAARGGLGVDPLGDSREYYTSPGPTRDDWGLWTYHVPIPRVLADLAAKRRIVGELSYDGAGPREWLLQVLASVYAEHPDFDPTWSLSTV